MHRSKTREAAENFSPNIVGSKKIMAKHASIESVLPQEELNSMNNSDIKIFSLFKYINVKNNSNMLF